MKRINLLLTPILGLSSIAGLAIPMTSCGCSQETTSHIVYTDSKVFDICHGDTLDLNFKLDEPLTKEDIKSITLQTNVEDFFAYTFDINDKVLTIHLTQVNNLQEYDYDVDLDVEISTSNWTDAVKGFKFVYNLEKETYTRVSAFEDTGFYFELAEGKNLQYSYDKKTWSDVTNGLSIDVAKGKNLYLKGNNPTGLAISDYEFTCIYIYNKQDYTKPCANIIGDAMSLLNDNGAVEIKELPSMAFGGLFWGANGIEYVTPRFLSWDKQLSSYCYYALFYGCGNLVAVPKLPSKQLASNCYYELFYECGNLVTAPELPATELAEGCYSEMFYGCTKLTKAPDLEATILPANCYSVMFDGCSSLVEPPKMAAVEVGENSCDHMFSECKSLKKTPNLSATKLGANCYNTMFSGCTSLVETSPLPAETLADSCYHSMFNNCKSLVTAPALPAKELTNKCYYNMFYGCESLINAPELPATKLAECCYYSMFWGCSSLKVAPAIQADVLVNGSCEGMFNDCKSLVEIPDIKATTLQDRACYQMYGYCTSLTKACKIEATKFSNRSTAVMFIGCTGLKESTPFNTSAELDEACCHRMFEGCTSLTKVYELPGTELKIGCFQKMFYGCKSLLVSNKGLESHKILTGLNWSGSYWPYLYMFEGTKSEIEISAGQTYYWVEY